MVGGETIKLGVCVAFIPYPHHSAEQQLCFGSFYSSEKLVIGQISRGHMGRNMFTYSWFFNIGVEQKSGHIDVRVSQRKGRYFVNVDISSGLYSYSRMSKRVLNRRFV